MSDNRTLRSAIHEALSADDARPPPDSEAAILAAQQRLTQAILRLNMTPSQAGIAGFANVAMTAARCDALSELFTEDNPALKSALSALLVKYLTQRAEQLELQSQRPQIQIVGRA